MRTAGILLTVLLLVHGILEAQAQTTESHTFTNLNKAIPDGNASGLSDLRSVNSAISQPASIRVSLHITGEFNGDLYGYLRHIQSGTTNICILLNRPGRTASNPAGYTDAGLDVLFSDAATNRDIHVYRTVTNLTAGLPLTGLWQPDGRRVDPEVVLDTTERTNTLGSFCGMDPSGEWTLFLADLESGGTNMLVSWGLEITGIACPPISWPTPADIVYGTALGPAQLNATSAVSGTFTYHPPEGTVLNAGESQLLSVTFTPTDTNSYAPVTNTVQINVNPAPLVITANARSKTYGTTLELGTTAFTVGSGLASGESVTVVTLTADGGPAVGDPAGSYTITPSAATGMGGFLPGNYLITYVSGILTVNPAATLGVFSSSLNPARPGETVTFTYILNPAPPSAGIPTGYVQFKVDGTNAGSPVAVASGIASFSTASLAVGSHTVIAEYPGDSNFIGTTNGLSTNQLVNTPPLAGPDTVEREPTGNVKVSIATLLGNDTDADGDSVAFVYVTNLSANGGTVAASEGWIYYTPFPGFTNTDLFTYVITDGRVAATGTVTVNVRVDTVPAPNLVVTDLGNGSYSIHFDGVPGKVYRIQFSESLNPADWQTLGSRTANEFGVFEYVDTPPGGAPSRFYRSVYP